MFENKDEMATVGAEPDLISLCKELARSTGENSGNNRVTRNEETRFCQWDGQSTDGKKWTANTSSGKQAFPWDGASDTRIPLADEVVNGLVDLTTTAFWRSMIKVSPNSFQTQTEASTAFSLMDWTLNANMYNNLTEEVELLAQYLWTYGWAGAHVSWQQEMGQKYQHLTMQEIVQMAQQAGEGTMLGTLPNMIVDPESEDRVVEIFTQVFPSIKKKRALKAVRELRKTGECDFPIPTILKNSPSVVALAPWDDISFPPETTDLQSARVIFRRAFLTEMEVRQKVLTDGWDEKWADEVIQRAGSGSDEFVLGSFTSNSAYDKANLIEVVYAYQKALDEDEVPGVFCTVFSPKINDSWGKFELIDYSHGLYPFVIWRTETLHRKITESRGVPEICATWQQEIKAQRDSIFDYTSLSTLPPIQVPKTRGGTLKLGPAVQIPVLRPGEISFMQPPSREPNVAFNLIQSIETQTDRYFGRPTEKVPPSVTQMRQQRIVSNWLHGWTAVFRQVLALTVQYVGPEEISRITGCPEQHDMATLDVTLKFDIRELSTDLVTEKLKAISSLVLPLDSGGVVDRTKLITLALRAIDPTLATELVIQQGPAAQKMFDETNQEMALIALGNPPKLRENDPTANTRLQFLQQIMQSNPKYQQSSQQDQLFQQNMQKYAENLQFSITQQQNAQTGRLGVQPN